MVHSRWLIGLFLMLMILYGQEGTQYQGVFGSVTIDGKIWNQIALRPVIPLGKFGLALDLVLYIDQEGNVHKEEWDFSSPSAVKNTLIDKIYYLRYGQKGESLYFKIGALDRVDLGYGILVAGYSNAIQYPQIRKVGLDFQARSSLGSLQGFVNDFKENIGLFGVRMTTTHFGPFPLGISLVVDRNQYLGLEDQDGDGRPDIVDDFPEDDHYWLDTDGDGWADNDTLREFDVDGDGWTDPRFTLPLFGVVLDSEVTRSPEPLNVHKVSDQIAALAVDVSYPVIDEDHLELTVYAQAAKLLGKTIQPDTSQEQIPLGLGLIPLGVASRFGPARINLEYRVIPQGQFEFAYWNRSYEVERAVIRRGIDGNEVSISTKEARLGRYGKQNGYFLRLSLEATSFLEMNAIYQHLVGSLWDQETARYQEEKNESFLAAIRLRRQISKLRYAQAYYYQRNVPNPFQFELTESSLLGYRVGFEISSGLVLNYVFQRTFMDLNGDGKIKGSAETVNYTTIETTFLF